MVSPAKRDVEEDENRKRSIVNEKQPEVALKNIRLLVADVATGGLHVISHDLSYRPSCIKKLLLRLFTWITSSLSAFNGSD